MSVEIIKIAKLKVQSSYNRNILLSNLADAGYLVRVVVEEIKDGFRQRTDYFIEIYEVREVDE